MSHNHNDQFWVLSPTPDRKGHGSRIRTLSTGGKWEQRFAWPWFKRQVSSQPPAASLRQASERNVRLYARHTQPQTRDASDTKCFLSDTKSDFVTIVRITLANLEPHTSPRRCVYFLMLIGLWLVCRATFYCFCCCFCLFYEWVSRWLSMDIFMVSHSVGFGCSAAQPGCLDISRGQQKMWK